MAKFILSDFSRGWMEGFFKKEDFSKFAGIRGRWNGHAIAGAYLERATEIDFTGPPGSVIGLYYSLMFQLGKWEWQTAKADEWIEVSPTHAQYYQLTHKQKEDLENKIKSGLASASQSVADLELMKHDERKYKEFLHYLGYKTYSELRAAGKKTRNVPPEEMDLIDVDMSMDEKERQKAIDNHSLRAVFIDQVDMHTGEGISIRSIVSRWPTLISDFMRMDDGDIDVEKAMKKLDISRAEAVVLVTKNKLYNEWKKLFLPEIRNRYRRITELVRSRNASVDSYRKWLEPYIMRHKMLEEGMADQGRRSGHLKSFMSVQGQAIAYSNIEIWAWKDFLTPEVFKMPGELAAKKPIPIVDPWTKKELIFNEKYGLIADHPWITDEWVTNQANEMLGPGGWITSTPNRNYYTFIIIKLDKTNIRMPTGEEMEDGTFDVGMTIMSKNAMFCKLLQLKAKEEETQQYINKLLGLPVTNEEALLAGKQFEPKKTRSIQKARDFFGWFGMNFQLYKGGPYERDWDERLTKFYLMPMAKERYGAVIGFIKKKIGYGTA
ncbi:MAG: hypothetical protein HY513_04415 [Candidatus Aenigmarchaeota archaeon]|nr:hypothetical protein [Candidatus Aenigmarchaeota archaeon]